MTEVARGTDRKVAADESPDAFVVDKRQFVRPLGERLNQFALRVKSNARWMRHFLHGGS